MDPTLVDYSDSSKFASAVAEVLKVCEIGVVWLNIIGVLVVLLVMISISREIAAMRKTPGDGR